VADPYLFLNLIARATWVSSGSGRTLQVAPTSWARLNGGSYSVGALGWRELYSKYRGSGLTTNLNAMRDQFICHQQFAFWKSTWNLDEWRSDVGYPKTVTNLCNPA
jgi:hypothetical protein